MAAADVPPFTVSALVALVPIDILMPFDAFSRAEPLIVIVAVLLSPLAGSNQVQLQVPPVRFMTAAELVPWARPPPELAPRLAVPPVIVNVPDDADPDAKKNDCVFVNVPEDMVNTAPDPDPDANRTFVVVTVPAPEIDRLLVPVEPNAAVPVVNWPACTSTAPSMIVDVEDCTSPTVPPLVSDSVAVASPV